MSDTTRLLNSAPTCLLSLLFASASALSLTACSEHLPESPTEPIAARSEPLAPTRALTGEVETILRLQPVTDMPEGIAFDQRGHLFVSNRRLSGATRVNEILEIAPDNTVSVIASFDGSPDQVDGGVLGLATDPRGNLYAALASSNAATHGVWRLRRSGGAERLAGSNQMKTPNALAFDAAGNLYVSDSEDGAIWRFPRAGPGELWIRHPLLAPDPNFGVGANGLAFVPPRSLYVANTDQGLIARIPIGRDGSPGEPSVAAAGFELLTVDGLAADAHGDLHAVIAGAGIFGTAPVVRVDPATGEITATTSDATAFDFPTSLAFGKGPRDHTSVYVVNAGLFPEGRPEAAPGVVRVEVRVPGIASR